MITLPDGTIIYPKRGGYSPPRPKMGYEILEGDPFTHVPTLYPCKHRESIKPDCTNCGAGAIKLKCLEGGKEEDIRRINCRNCGRREET